MLTIDTGRLQLLALTASHLRLYLTGPSQLERALGLQPSLTPATKALRRAIGLKLTAIAQVDERTLAWHTYWLVMITAMQAGAGFAGFKGSPDDAGRVEIGYGIEPARRRQGYATEAVAALIEWAFNAPQCRVVKARTQASNQASAAVLRKLGFDSCGSEDGQLLWRLDRSLD